MKKRLLASMLFGLIISQNTLASVSGMVYQDLPVNGTVLSTYGVRDANELGVAGVTVTAYQSDGTSQSMVTADDGLWALATTGDVRVELSNIPDYLKESPDGGNANSLVQFMADSSVVDFGLYNPSDFVTANQQLATTHYVNGKENPDGGPEPTLFSWPIDNRGVLDANQVTLATTSSNIRSAWGLAYSKTRKVLYSSTFLRRHSSIGSGSLGDIHATDLNSNTTSFVVSVPNAGTIGSDTDRQLGDASTGNRDTEAFAKVGKVGLGGLDISDDEQTLYVANLNDKSIYEIDIDTQQITSSYLAPAPSCTDGESRPFGLTFFEDNLYIGSVCDASTAVCNTDLADSCPQLTAHVYKIPKGSTSGTEVFSMRLDYEKDRTASLPTDMTTPGKQYHWNPWTDTYSDLIVDTNRLWHPVPLLTGLKFDKSGDLTIAFADRTAIQGGAENLGPAGEFERYAYGGADILRATKNNDGSYALQNVNYYDDNSTVIYHEEAAVGAVIGIMGSNNSIFTHYDNVGGVVHTKGVSFLDDTTGANTGAYRVADANRPAYFGKAMGIGDLELLTDPAPIEIGNRLWIDTDGNGVQDADESGLGGIDVELVCGGVTVSTVTTDVNGNYIFSNDPIPVSTNSHKYNIPELVAGVADCLVRIPNVSGGNKQAALGANSLTIANTGEGASSNQNDSDGIASGDNAEATVMAAEIRTTGANNHSFDFGFSSVIAPVPTGCTTINNTASITGLDQTDTNSSNDTASVSLQVNCATLDSDLELVKTADKSQVLQGDTLTYTLTLRNKGGSDATDVEVTDTLPTGVTFVSATVPSGTSFDDNTKVWTIPSLPSSVGNNVETLQIIVTVD